MLGRQTQKLVITWLLLSALVQCKLSSSDWVRCECWYNTCFIELSFQYLKNIPIMIYHKQIYCLSWNAWQQMTGHKFGLHKTFFIRGWLQFLIFCKTINTCSTKHKKHIHNYMKLLYSVRYFFLKKAVSHAIQWSLKKR